MWLLTRGPREGFMGPTVHLPGGINKSTLDL